MKPRSSGRFWRVPLDAGETRVPRGSVRILEERCKGCSYCVEFCPCDVLELSQRFNVKGYHPPDVVRHEECTGCRLCEILCPEFAIGVTDVVSQERADAS